MKTKQEIEQLRDLSYRHLQELYDAKLEHLFDDSDKFDRYDREYQIELAKYMTLCEVLK